MNGGREVFEVCAQLHVTGHGSGIYEPQDNEIVAILCGCRVALWTFYLRVSYVPIRFVLSYHLKLRTQSTDELSCSK